MSIDPSPTIKNPFFPIRISPTQRVVKDQSGSPFYIHGDSAWSLISALTEEEVEHYLANRAAKGFNALIVNLIEHKFNGPRTRSGDLPFKDLRDLSTTNEHYFDFAGWVLEQAAAHGMLVFLAPLFLGYKHPANDDGWYHEARLSGPEKLAIYGQYIGRRYSHLENIMWLIGCDRNPIGIEEEIHSLVMGIKGAAPQQLFSAQPAPEEVTTEWYGGTNQGGWLNLNTTYTYGIVHKRLLANYNRKPAMPFVLIESTYEGEHNATPVQIRRQAYWAMLCGACGQFMGNNPIWLFNPGWQASLDQAGSQSMVHVKCFFTSRPWYDLVPDQKHEIVTQGLGEFNGMDYLTAALTADGSTLMAYLPTAREISVDLSKMPGRQVHAIWFNPRTGQPSEPTTYRNQGVQKMSPPGEGDWALIVDDAALNLPVPGK